MMLADIYAFGINIVLQLYYLCKYLCTLFIHTWYYNKQCYLLILINIVASEKNLLYISSSSSVC